MITKINHIGIAVKSIEESLKLYTEVLGLELKNIEVVEDQKTRTAVIPVGESAIELLESTEPDGAIAKFIAKKGEGLHHLSFEVENVAASLKTVEEKGIVLIDKQPRKGVDNTRIGFLHPRQTKVLLELVQLPSE